MRSLSRWLLVLSGGLALAAAPPAPGLSGKGDAYRAVGDIAIQHEGRVKPLDTFARLEVKQIYGRESMKLLGPEDEVIGRWEPLAALFDWSARPNFWNDKDIILVDYGPVKVRILAKPIRQAIESVQSSDKAPAPARELAKTLARDAAKVTSDQLRELADVKGLPAEQRTTLRRLADKLGPDHKWVSADDIEAAEIDDDGHSHSFMEWIAEIDGKQSEARRSGGDAKAAVSEIEKHAYDVGSRYDRFLAHRDRNSRGFPPYDWNLFPRPKSAAYLSFTAGAMAKGAKDSRSLTPLELDAALTLRKYWEDIRSKDRKLPGAKGELDETTKAFIKDRRPDLAPTEEFDSAFAEWLGTKSGWLALRIILDSDLGELARAGLPTEKVEQFRKSFESFTEAERKNPGQPDRAAAEGLLASARGLSVATESPYPAPEVLARESFYNRFAPFYKAPVAYGIALVLLLVSMGMNTAPRTAARSIDRGLYALGMAAFICGIALEIYGFYFRVRISGWAPVTNMYETVIWVGLITALIGLVLEAVYRRKFAATAAAGVSLLATVLAANVSLLDPDIKNLTPVLRSNYWLTIHVLTIVSSYAAFALAMGLGLLGTMFYLAATYRRSPTWRELAAPLYAGVPLAAVGLLGVTASNLGWMDGRLSSTASYVVVAILAEIGMILTITAVFAVIGELANRSPAKLLIPGLAILACGLGGFTALAFGRSPAAWPDWLSYPLCLSGVTAIGLGMAVASRIGIMIQSGALRQRLMSAGLDASSIAGDEDSGERIAVGSAAATATATVSRSVKKPSVSQIRAMAAAAAGGPGKSDPREAGMQATAERIKPLASFVYRAMQVGVLLVAAGTILGGVWAAKSWGRFWGWDSKEVWALITLIVYLIPLHGRFAGWVNTFGLVAASVACFASVLMAWYGVNFVLGVGLHSYGFTGGGGQGAVITASLAVLGVVCAAAWRRSLGHRAVEA